MMEWLSANGGTILGVIVLAAVVALVIRSIVNDKKAGRSSCGAGCANCAMKGSCHKK